MINRIYNLWNTKPLLVILIIAAFFRLISAILSKGYAMSDDHFVVIEVAQNWIDGDFAVFEKGKASAHSIVYPGLHYLLFYLLAKIQITDPQIKMLIVRLIHAIYSMLIVWMGYLITQKLSDEKTAKKVGLILALFWILPFMSVRNLIEVVCIPPAMIAIYLAIRGDESGRMKWWILAGAMFGLSFAFRYQMSLMILGVGIVLLFQKKMKPLIIFSVGFLSGAFIFQGIVDWISWGYPFASFHSYLTYNIEHRYDYLVGPWYLYIGLLLSVFIPPISILLGYGFLRAWKRYTLIFIPTALFLIFHSYFPNKQERFILPILPFFTILGIIGWDEFIKNSAFWEKRKKFLRGFWVWFWVINSILLLIVSPTYSKKNRVETLYYLSNKDDVNSIIIESVQSKVPLPPRYYLNKQVDIYFYPQGKSWEQLLNEIDENKGTFPNYIIMLGKKGIDERLSKFKSDFSVELDFMKKINPSLIDDILYQMNPQYNVNQTSYIYKINKR